LAFAAVPAVASGARLVTTSGSAQTTPVTGGFSTVVDRHFDGPGHCLDGNPGAECDQYDGKQFVWINAGPDAHKLLPDGNYFFTVIEPGSHPDPNDGSAGNLSDDFDSHDNRTFTIVNGEIASYAGTHIQDIDTTNNNERVVRPYPYDDTTNSGGVYLMAVCPLSSGYPVDPASCTYDAFKLPLADVTAPVCMLTATGETSGHKYIQVTVQDVESGLETLDYTADNATVDPIGFFVGDPAPITVTATKTDVTQGSRLTLRVTDVAGLTIPCDPVWKGNPRARQHQPNVWLHVRALIRTLSRFSI
jgi:hypothetical protein